MTDATMNGEPYNNNSVPNQRTSITRTQIREAALLDAMLASEGGKVFMQVVHDRYATYLSEILDERHSPDQLARIRDKVTALLDVMNDVGVKISNAEIDKIQKMMAKRHLQDELMAHSRN